MPSTQEFRKRIKSVNNTRTITRAMEMVASVKMQKAVRNILEARTYVQTAWNLIELFKAKKPADLKHPFLRSKPVGKTAVILISSDRGLCGSFNSDILKKMAQFQAGFSSEADDNEELMSENYDVVAVGKFSSKICRKLGLNMVAEFSGFENEIGYEDTTPVTKLIIDNYLDKVYGRIIIVYSHFISSLSQTPVSKQILPVESNHIDNLEIWESKSPEFLDVEFKFEPDIKTLLDQVLPQFIRMQIYGAILESNASEHSARMVAMKNATDSAGDIISDLTLTYNTVRQDNITREIAEISGAAEAMS